MADRVMGVAVGDMAAGAVASSWGFSPEPEGGAGNSGLGREKPPSRGGAKTMPRRLRVFLALSKSGTFTNTKLGEANRAAHSGRALLVITK